MVKKQHRESNLINIQLSVPIEAFALSSSTSWRQKVIIRLQIKKFRKSKKMNIIR